MKYRVKGLCVDEEDVIHLGTITVDAENETEAENEAWKELWDSRLSGAGCGFRALIEEVPWWEVDEDESD